MQLQIAQTHFLLSAYYMSRLSVVRSEGHTMSVILVQGHGFAQIMITVYQFNANIFKRNRNIHLSSCREGDFKRFYRKYKL